MSDEPFAGRVNAVESFKVSLIFQIQESGTDRLSDPALASKPAPMCLVHVLNRVFGSGHDDDEAGSLIEGPEQSLSFFCQLLSPQHRLGGLKHNGEHTSRPTALADYRAIVQIHPDLFRSAV